MTTQAPPLRHLYRSLLRELRLSAPSPRASRTSPVRSHLRDLVTSVQADRPAEASRIVAETRDFLRASRIHNELLRRYNPTHDMTPEEKVKATARRVGLNTPLKYEEE